LLQIGYVNAGKKLGNVEVSSARGPLPAAIVRVDIDRQIDVTRLDPAVDERLAAIVQRASHIES